MVSIFTATYNRAYCIGNLYNSLCEQTCFNFEWIIVDDGSCDNTEKLIQSYINERKISIQYFKQTNQGKHIAFNKGVSIAKGELFFFVDSDDSLAFDAVEFLQQEFDKVKYNESFAGISGTRIDKIGNRIGGRVNFAVIDANTLDFRYILRIKGDMAEAYKTNVLKQYPFPIVEGEKFCSEAYVWNQMSQKYKLRFFNRGIYVCEYLPDGLTAKINHIRMLSPITSMMYYSEFYNMNIPFIQKIKAAINYWRFACCSSKNFSEKISKISYLALFAFPMGYLFHLRDIQNEDTACH